MVPYVHNQVAPGLGKIGVLVALESRAPVETLDRARQADRDARRRGPPTSADGEELRPKLIERERSIAMEKARESGKPQNIIEKMVEGAFQVTQGECADLAAVRDGQQDPGCRGRCAAAKDAGTGIELKGYVRFQLGEGIEKKVDDFAAEVAAASGVKKNPEPVA